MSLHAAIEAELPFLRAEAEALFTDDFELREYGNGWRFDAAAKKDVREFSLLYGSRGKVITSTQSSEAQVGDRTAATVRRELHLPASSAAVPVDTVAFRIADGVEFRVLADVTNAHPKTRRLYVEEVLK